ncbi:MAG: tRNA (adenosine(37)-N6)-threonylcarbamoyltransferase complex ATPase subunit type 1 TsaE, partial [Candidatus Shapirobacteria bacterium]
TLISKSEKETGKIAEFLLKKHLGESVIFALTGDLGCGKTVFSRKIGHLLGVKEKITSPTFVIYNEYQIPLPVVAGFLPLTKGILQKFLHMDLYKITTERDLEEIRFFSLFSKNTITCIEWPENMGEENFERLKKEHKVVTIKFKYLEENIREIKY